MNQLITLSSINETDLQKVGQRALDLSSAYKTKANTPLSFVVPNSVFYEFLLQNKLILQIPKILSDLDRTDESAEKAYSQIKMLFERATIPEEFKEELLESYEALSKTMTHSAQAFLEGDEPIVNLIISPNYIIDSEKLSGVLFNIQGFDNFLNGLKSCWLALYSPEHLKFRNKKGISDFTSGIIVQEFVQPDCTIDAYSKSIIGDYDLPINAYFGLPDITYSIEKDHYSVSKETFEIVLQEVKNQSHVLVRNIKSGTLLKRSLGSKGLAQKIENRQILDTARSIERLSIMTKLHFRIIMFLSKSKNAVFLIDRISERNPEQDKREEKQENGSVNLRSTEFPAKSSDEDEIKILPESARGETLAELINSHMPKEEKNDTYSSSAPANEVAAEMSTTPEDSGLPEEKKPGNAPSTIPEDLPHLAQESPEPGETEEIQSPKEKIIILDGNEDFILSSNENLEETTPESREPAHEKISYPHENEKNDEVQANPDNNFFMSIILDIEPALDQEILRRYQEKFEKIPLDVNIALEELSASGHFPENEQVFKLKNMKSILERGETINLEVFLEVTERLRKLI